MINPVEPRDIADNQPSLNVRKSGDIGSLVIISLINLIGWLVMYFIVLSLQADHNKAQTRLFDAQNMKLQRLVDRLERWERSGRVQLGDSNKGFIELQVSRLEAATAQLEEQLANIGAQTQTTADLNLVRQGLRPNLLFGKFEFTFSQNDNVELEHEIRNIGSNAALVAAPAVSLSLRPIADEATSDALLVADKDYSVRVYRPGMFQSGYAAKISYSIKLLNQTLKGSVIHYKLQWQASTDPLAVSTAAKILGKQISSAELKRLSEFTQILRGTITFNTVGN